MKWDLLRNSMILGGGMLDVNIARKVECIGL